MNIVSAQIHVCMFSRVFSLRCASTFSRNLYLNQLHTPLVGMIAMGLSPLYLILNSPDLDPWLISEISLAIVLLLATTLPKSTIWSTSSIGCGGYLK